MVSALVSALVGLTGNLDIPYVIQNGGIKIDGRPSAEAIGTHISLSPNNTVENTDPVPATVVIDATSQVLMFDNTRLIYTGKNGEDSKDNEIFELLNGAIVYTAAPVDIRTPSASTPRRRRVVRTPNRSTIAIGTAFFMKNEVRNFRLSVTSGGVEFVHRTDSNKTLTLKQGEFVQGKDDDDVTANGVR